MTVRIVDLLEVVDVEEHERDAGAVALRALELELELVRERGVVEEIGEWVVPGLVRKLRGRAVEVGDDALGNEAVDHRVQALLEHEDVAGFKVGAAVEYQSPEHAPQDQELGDDVARSEAERLAFARMVPDECGERAPAVQALGLGMDEVLSELGDEGRHVAELSDPT